MKTGKYISKAPPYSGECGIGVMPYVRIELKAMMRTSMARRRGIVFPLILIACAYYVGLSDRGADWQKMLYVMCAIASPSLIPGSMMFATESNFFDGIWARPCSPRSMFEAKYRFYALMNCVAALLLVPLAVMGESVSLPQLLSMLVYIAGLCNMSLFVSSFCPVHLSSDSYPYFNSWEYMLYLWLFPIPFIIIAGVYFLLYIMCDVIIANSVGITLGILGLWAHPFAVRFFANRYSKSSCTIIENYRK